MLGALSSGLLLYGAILTYGYAGTTSFAGIIAATAGAALPLGLIFGLVFLAAGLAFKVSAAPFHMWTPDVYEGSPTPVTAFFATAPKVAAIGAVRPACCSTPSAVVVGRLAADPRLPVGRLDVPRRDRRHRPARHQAADGLFLDRATWASR